MSKLPPSPELDALLHQPVRTRIVAYLIGRGEATFVELKNALDVTDGNLEAHLKKLIAADYLAPLKEAEDGRPQTLYKITRAGRAALRTYVGALHLLLGTERRS